MNRCKTCRHWDPVGPNEWRSLAGSGGCTAARQIWDVTEITPEDDDEQLKLLPEHAGLLCMVSDGSEYKAELITMPDFGCIMHNPKLPSTEQRADHIPDAGEMVQTAQTAQPVEPAVSDALAIVEAELLRLKASFAGLSAIGVLRYAAKDMSITTQPQQSTPSVQPKIPPFLESMHSYKTVWTHLEAEQIEDYGRRCFAAGISAGQQPQQSAAMPEFEVVQKVLTAYADSQYCKAVGLFQKPECLGWESKAINGKFSNAEYAAHKAANEAMGAHKGIYSALVLVRAAINPTGGTT